MNRLGFPENRRLGGHHNLSGRSAEREKIKLPPSSPHPLESVHDRTAFILLSTPVGINFTGILPNTKKYLKNYI